jgi:hypothetical protein
MREVSATVDVGRREIQALRIAVRPVAHLDRGVELVEGAMNGRILADGFAIDVISTARDTVRRDILQHR